MVFKDKIDEVSNLHDFSLWVLRERLGVKRYSEELQCPAPLGWQGCFYIEFLCLWGVESADAVTGMAVNQTPILL
ncbi:hypothetical protein U3516DRAFT_765836 [Neocallimastix sp. 'constans']